MTKMTKSELQYSINIRLNENMNLSGYYRMSSDKIGKMCEYINKYSTITGYYVEFTYIPKKQNRLTITVNGEYIVNNKAMTNTKMHMLIDIIYMYVDLINIGKLEIVTDTRLNNKLKRITTINSINKKDNYSLIIMNIKEEYKDNDLKNENVKNELLKTLKNSGGFNGMNVSHNENLYRIKIININGINKKTYGIYKNGSNYPCSFLECSNDYYLICDSIPLTSKFDLNGYNVVRFNI